MFGIYMQKALKQPILIIKTAWGGKSLYMDSRPPSAGTFELSETDIEKIKQRGGDVVTEIAYTRETMDVAAGLGGSLLNTWPGQDGHDCPLQGRLQQGARLARREVRNGVTGEASPGLAGPRVPAGCLSCVAPPSSSA